MKKLLKNESNREALPKGSVRVAQDVVDAFVADPENTFLVSFPRTGSHWLRMLMELYFQRPSLVRVFYFNERADYMCYHTHDLDLVLPESVFN